MEEEVLVQEEEKENKFYTIGEPYDMRLFIFCLGV